MLFTLLYEIKYEQNSYGNIHSACSSDDPGNQIRWTISRFRPKWPPYFGGDQFSYPYVSLVNIFSWMKWLVYFWNYHLIKSSQVKIDWNPRGHLVFHNNYVTEKTVHRRLFWKGLSTFFRRTNRKCACFIFRTNSLPVQMSFSFGKLLMRYHFALGPSWFWLAFQLNEDFVNGLIWLNCRIQDSISDCSESAMPSTTKPMSSYSNPIPLTMPIPVECYFLLFTFFPTLIRHISNYFISSM